MDNILIFMIGLGMGWTAYHCYYVGIIVDEFIKSHQENKIE